MKRRRLLANPFPDLGLYSPAKHSSDFLQPEWPGNVWPGNNLLLGPLKTAKNPSIFIGVLGFVPLVLLRGEFNCRI